MKKSDIIVIWNLSKSIWLGSSLFWIAETVIFLIYEGWHLKPTNPIEIWCDKIICNMWMVALWLTVFCAVSLLFNLKTKSK